MKRTTLILLLFLTVAAAQDLILRRREQVSGVVLFPDGTPAVGAVVEAVTNCPDDAFNVVEDVTTAEDGEFNIPPFYGNCRRLRLSAQKGMWLKTGKDVFYGKQIGTTPFVQVSDDGAPQRVEIRLGELGGRVDVRVWDRATQRFIYAGLSVRRLPVAGLKFGSMDIATGRDGSADTLILPSGTYEFSVDRFACGNGEYVSRTPPREQVQVRAGERVETNISIDVRNMRPSQTYNNPSGQYCRP